MKRFFLAALLALSLTACASREAAYWGSLAGAVGTEINKDHR